MQVKKAFFHAESLDKNISFQCRIQDFPLGEHRPMRGCQPPMRTLFGENIHENMYENERIGSCWEGAGGAALNPPLHFISTADKLCYYQSLLMA